MKTVFFFCALKLRKINILSSTPSYTEHVFHELIELENDETVPEAFDKWLSIQSESLVQGIDERAKAKAILINMYVVA